jgi:hypothetical protein
MDLVEDATPIRVLKTCEAECLVETAVAGDTEIGTEDHADAAADVAQSRCCGIRPGGTEETQTFVIRVNSLYAEK